MYRLLTLVSALGLAAAENCEDFDCTSVLSANGGGASAQTVSTHVLFD